MEQVGSIFFLAQRHVEWWSLAINSAAWMMAIIECWSPKRWWTARPGSRGYQASDRGFFECSKTIHTHRSIIRPGVNDGENVPDHPRHTLWICFRLKAWRMLAPVNRSKSSSPLNRSIRRRNRTSGHRLNVWWCWWIFDRFQISFDRRRLRSVFLLFRSFEEVSFMLHWLPWHYGLRYGYETGKHAPSWSSKRMNDILDANRSDRQAGESKCKILEQYNTFDCKY